MNFFASKSHDFLVLGSIRQNIYTFRKVDDFTHCCAAKAAKDDVICDIRHQDGLSNCDELLKYTFLKYFLWILGILALVGNLVVILWRYILCIV